MPGASDRGLVLLACAGLGALLLFQQFGGIGRSDLFGRALSNSLHVPLFATVALLVSFVLRGSAWPLRLTVCAMLAALTEALQMFSSRQASLLDFSLDLLGVLGVLLGLELSRRTPARAGLIWAGVLATLVLATVAAPARIWASYVERDRLFPVLFEPGSRLLRPLWSSNSASRIVRPGQDAGFTGDRVLEVEWAQVRFPAVTLSEPVADWSGYRVLRVEIQVHDDRPMPLTVAVSHQHMEGTSAFTRMRGGGAGRQVIEFPLVELLPTRPGVGIDRVILHTDAEAAGRRLSLGRIRLAR